MIKIFHEGKVPVNGPNFEYLVNEFLKQLKSERRSYTLSYQSVPSSYGSGYLIVIVEY